jgi:hypothetical protein
MALYHNEAYTANKEFGVLQILDNVRHVGTGTVIQEKSSIKTSGSNDFLFRNLINYRFCGTYTDNGCMVANIGGNIVYPSAILYLFIQPTGTNFCQKFHEAYKNLDNLNAQ